VRAVYPSKEKARGDLIDVYSYLKEDCKEDGAKVFSVVPSDRTTENGNKLKHRSFPLNITKHFLFFTD